MHCRCVCLYFALRQPSQCGTAAELRHCPLTSRGVIVNEDTDSGQSQLCRGPTEWTQSPGVMDLIETGMALESGCKS